MAESYNKNLISTMNFAVSFKPQSAFPLDSRSMFGSYNDAYVAAQSAENAGSTNTIYYFGQILTVFENGIVSHYSIQADKSLKAIGAQVIGDEKTITVGENGTLSLKNFGIKYFKYIPKDNIVTGEYTYPDTMPENVATGSFVKIANVWYVLGEDGWAAAESEPVTEGYHELTDGWKSGLTPQVVMNETGNGYEIAWYEPSTVTVEGLSSSMSSLQNDVKVLTNKVNTVDTDLTAAIEAETKRATEAESGLRTDVNANKQSIDTLNADASTEGSVKYQIAEVINTYLADDDDNSSMNTLAELVEWANTHASDVLTMNTNITANATAINALRTLVGNLPEGAQATTVIAYISELVNAEKARAEGKEKELSDRITDLENNALTDPSQFATAEQGSKADTAVQNVVAGETNGHISVDGNDVTVYTLDPAKVNKLGGIMPDGSSISTNENGVASVVAVDSSKVTGLDTKLTETKNSAVTDAKEYADETFIPTANVVSSDNIASSIEDASKTKVVSEEVLLNAMTWSTSM